MKIRVCLLVGWCLTSLQVLKGIPVVPSSVPSFSPAWESAVGAARCLFLLSKLTGAGPVPEVASCDPIRSGAHGPVDARAYLPRWNDDAWGTLEVPNLPASPCPSHVRRPGAADEVMRLFWRYGKGARRSKL